VACREIENIAINFGFKFFLGQSPTRPRDSVWDKAECFKAATVWRCL